MKQYHDLLKRIIDEGTQKGDRTGTGTRSIFGHQMIFNLNAGFPLLTTKKIHTKSIIHELLWFLKGDTNTAYLNQHKVRIWDEWADVNGELGPIYGKQWRAWQGGGGEIFDQIQDVIIEIKRNPNSRRLVVNAWNVSDLKNMALTPCHCMFQFYVSLGKLSCHLYQRSADAFLGVPFNIASYALLTHMIAHVCNLDVGNFIHSFGDLHIYNNHFEQVKIQLSRSVNTYPLSTLWLNPAIDSINSFKYEDIVINNYKSYPSIKAEISV